MTIKPKQNEGFVERLNRALDAAGAPPKYQGRTKWMAMEFGISKTAAYRWLEDLATPDQKRWEEIATRLGVRIEWLFFNLGPMQLEAAPGDGPELPTRPGGQLLGVILDAVYAAAPELSREQRLTIASHIFTALHKN